MTTSSSSDCSGDYLHALLPTSPIAAHQPDFDWEDLADDVALQNSDATRFITGDGCQSRITAHHPLALNSNADSVEDMFDALDALLESEFPMETALNLSPDMDCSGWTETIQLESSGASQTTDLLRSYSCITTDAVNSTLTPGTTAAAGPAVCSPSADVARSAPTPASSPDAQTAGAIAAAVSAVRAATARCSMDEVKPMPRWKLYHLQQQQELLAPKQSAVSPASSDTEGSCQVGLPAAAAPLALAAMHGSTSPVSLAATTCMGVPACNSGSVTSSFTGSAAISSGTMASTAAASLPSEQLFLLNAWQQQQQAHLLQQQQQRTAIVGSGKRALALSDYSVPKVKRSRTSAAGNVAAQHLYGLSAEPSQQLQQLQSLQLQLHAQLHQSYQHQVEQYQQQQIQALHHQLHMRLQVQQHQQALQMQMHGWGGGRQAQI